MTNSWLGVNVLVDASTGVDYIMRIRPVCPVMILSQNRYGGFQTLNQHGLLSTKTAHRHGAGYAAMRQSGAPHARNWRTLLPRKWNGNCIDIKAAPARHFMRRCGTRQGQTYIHSQRGAFRTTGSDGIFTRQTTQQCVLRAVHKTAHSVSAKRQFNILRSRRHGVMALTERA